MSEEITIKKDIIWKIATIVLLVIVIIGAFGLFGGSDDSGLPEKPERVNVGVDDDAILGSEGARVTIVEFSDYECPFCARFWAQTLPSIKSNYIDTGKVNFVYRDFPLSGHPMAMPSAEAAECVREQGGDEAYYDFHDKIFENQQTLSRENLLKWADETGYDINSCFNSNKFALEVNADLREGSSAGITGTPGFFVLMEKEDADIEDLIAMQVESTQRPGTYVIRYIETNDGLVGARIIGAHPFDAFEKAIEAGL